jgi:sugar lactone lactonase YvrE
LAAYHPEKFSARASFSKKNFSSDGHFGRLFSFMAMKGKLPNQKKEITPTTIRASKITTSLPKKGTKMNPLTQFKKILILPLLSLGAIFALAITAHAQNLYVSAQVPPSHAILEFTTSGPSGGTPTTFASGLSFPRGLAFDSIGNLFAANNPAPDNIEIGRVLKFNLLNHVSTVGSAAKFFFQGLAIDTAGNAYVMATGQTSSTGTIFKFTPSGERTVFGTVPGVPNPVVSNGGLAFDSTGNLYATASGAQTIYKFAPDGTRSVFVGGPSAFQPGENPFGLAFDKSGNLFVSIETFSGPGADSIVYFTTPGGVRNPFATGLTTPRGLAFDTSGNLFVAEVNQTELNQPGDILEFPAPLSGDSHKVFFSFSHGRPEFLTFGPPR